MEMPTGNDTYCSDFTVLPRIYYRYAKQFLEKSRDSVSYEDAHVFSAVSIILSFMTLEAFINGYAAHYVFDELKKPETERCNKRTIDYLLEKNGNVNIGKKLLKWTKIITGKTFKESEEPWATFKYVKKLRNAIIHLKQEAANIQEVRESFPVIKFEVVDPFFRPKRYEDINPQNAQEALNNVKDMINKLTEFRGWPQPTWLDS